MKMLISTILKQTVLKARPDVFDVVVVIGGLMAEVVKYHGRRSRTKTFMFDNPNDLESWKALCQELNVDTVSLGKGHTTATLSESESSYIQSVFKRVASMNATTGCGASPLVGYLVAMSRILLSDFSLLLRRLSTAIRSATNSAPTMIRLRLKSSYCGGTATGAFRPILDRFIRELSRFGVNVQVELDVTGSVTFAEVSDRSRTTAAAVLPFALAYTLDRSDPRQLQVTKHLMIGELPPLRDKAIRDSLALVEEVALTCPQFRDHFEMIRPNHSTTGVFGNVTIKETDFFEALDLFDDFAAEVATMYVQLITEANDSIVPDSALVGDLEYVDQSTQLSPKPITSIVDSFYDFSADTLLEAIKKPEAHYVYRLFISMALGNRYDTSKLQAIFAKSPDTLAETLSTARLIATFIERLRTELDSRESTIAEIEHDVAVQESMFRKGHALLIGKRMSNRSRQRLSQQMTIVAHNLRTLSDDLANQEAAKCEIEKALGDLTSELSAIQDRLKAVSDMLRSFLPDGSINSAKKTVIPTSLEQVFSELVKVVRKPRRQQAEMLRQCVSLVTAEGIAKIVGAPSARVDAITDAAVYGTPRYRAVPHGGVSQQDVPNTIYFFPRTEDYLEDQLVAQIKVRDIHAKTVFLHTLIGGANVLRSRFRFPSTIEEIFCGSFPYDLQEALDSPNADLMFPGDRSYAALAGVHIDGNSFYLADPTPAIADEPKTSDLDSNPQL